MKGPRAGQAESSSEGGSLSPPPRTQPTSPGHWAGNIAPPGLVQQRWAECQAQNLPAASDGHGASFQSPLIIQRNSPSVRLFPSPPPMHTAHTCTTCTDTHTTHMNTPPHRHTPHMQENTIHAGSVCAHITHPHLPHVHHKTYCTHATCMHTGTQTCKHTDTCVHARSCQSSSHPIRRQTGPLVNIPKGGAAPCSPNLRAQARFQLLVPLLGAAILTTSCLPHAFHPHPKLWLVGRVINKK